MAMRSALDFILVCGMDDFEIFLSPRCGHKYCFQCWKFHTISRLQQRLDVCCMDRSCKLVLTGSYLIYQSCRRIPLMTLKYFFRKCNQATYFNCIEQTT